MIEILAGGGIEKAFASLGINAKNTYKHDVKNNSDDYSPKYEVWQLSDDEHKRLCNIKDEDWQDEWGWWRSSDGSVMGDVNDTFTIRGVKINAWRGSRRDDLVHEREDEPGEEKKAHADFEEYAESWYPHTYSDLLSYFCDELGASMERNVCALSVDLARQNGMTMGELFTKLLG